MINDKKKVQKRFIDHLKCLDCGYIINIPHYKRNYDTNKDDVVCPSCGCKEFEVYLRSQ